MRNNGISITILGAIVLAGLFPATALGDASAPRGESAVQAPRAEPVTVESEPSPSQCPAIQTEGEALEPQTLNFVPEKIYLEDPFDCWYCSGCAGSLVNKACCYHGNGNYFCVSSCSSGCQEPQGPVEPEG